MSLRLLAVCTGNVCRSPQAALVLAERLAPLGGSTASAGTRAHAGDGMSRRAGAIAIEAGAAEASVAAHTARLITERDVAPAEDGGPDLVIAMAREHRREIVELDPRRTRSTFTAREFARLAGAVDDAALADAAAAGGWPAVLDALARARGATPPPADPADDDVTDPIGLSDETYRLSYAQLAPALAQLERVARLVARHGDETHPVAG